LISSSAKRVGRSSCGAWTGGAVREVGAGRFAPAERGGGDVGCWTGTMRGGAAGRVACEGARVTFGSGCPGVRGEEGEAAGGEACHTGCCGAGLSAGADGRGGPGAAGFRGFAARATGFPTAGGPRATGGAPERTV